jgi:hypothetical protein
MRLLPLLVTLPMFAACGGDDGNVVSVFPESGFAGRSTTVEITGVDTSFGGGSTVDFGDGVTVDAITILSGNALQADITIAADADLGFTDVSVDGSTIVGAFEVLNPVSVEALIPVAQGGVGLFVITNLDLLHPFDTTTDAETGDFTGVDVSVAGTGFDAFVSNVTENEVVIQMFADVDASGGGLTITSQSEAGPFSTVVGNPDVETRTAIVLTEGTPAMATLDTSALYEITLTKDQLLALEVIADSKESDLEFVILPASGKWSDSTSGFTTSSSFLGTVGQKFYVSLVDLNLETGYTYELNATTAVDLTGVAPTPEVEPNETSGTGTTGTGTLVHFTATLANDTDVDFFKVTVGVNQRIHVRTTAGDGATDTQISIFAPNGTTLVKDDNGDDIDGFDAGFGEDVVSAPQVAPGTYFVKIEPSAFGLIFGYMPANDPYDALITIE